MKMKLLWLWSIVAEVSIVGMTASTLMAQTPTDPNTDRFPQSIPAPVPLPPDLPPKPTVTPNPDPVSPDDARSVVVSQIRVVGSTVFTATNWTPIIQPLVGTTTSIGELKNIADRLTQLYLDRGAITSRFV